MKENILKRVSIIMILVLLFMWSAYPLLAASDQVTTEPNPEKEKLLQNIKDILNLSQIAQQSITKDTFDVKSVLDITSVDVAKVFEWVRDNTYFVHYDGVLRGAQGVLMDRMGNSFDRSLLLAELLRLAKKEVRLSHSMLTQTQAADISTKIRAIPETGALSPMSSSQEEFKDKLTKLAAERNVDVSLVLSQFDKMTAESMNTMSQLSERVAAQTASIRAVLADAIPENLEQAGNANKPSSDVDHWWVQYKNGSEWIDLDVTLPESKPGERIIDSKETFELNKLPENQFHRVQLNVVIERRENDGTLVEESVLEQSILQKDFLEKQIVLHHFPPDESKTMSAKNDFYDLQAFQKLAQECDKWLPVLTVGKNHYTDRVFSNSGLTESYSFRGSAGPLMGGTRSLFGEGLIAVGEQEKLASMLTAEWIDYTIFVPGKTSERIRRQIFDLLGSERSHNEKSVAPVIDTQMQIARAMSILSRTDILISPCRISPQYIENLFIADFIENGKYLVDLLEKNDTPTPRSLIELVAKLSAHHGPLLQLASSRFSFTKNGWNTYIARPNILSFHTFLRPDNKAGVSHYRAFDIVANFVEAAPGSKQNPYLLRLEQGIIDTNAEAFMFKKDCDCSSISNTASLYQQSMENWVLVKDVSDIEKKGVAIPKEFIALVKQDILDGNYIIAPKTLQDVNNEQKFAWWRINPQTGQTLGLADNGWGIQMSNEAQALYILVSLTTIEIALIWCARNAHTDWQKFRCVLSTICDMVLLYLALSSSPAIVVWYVLTVESLCRFA